MNSIEINLDTPAFRDNLGKTRKIDILSGVFPGLSGEPATSRNLPPRELNFALILFKAINTPPKATARRLKSCQMNRGMEERKPSEPLGSQSCGRGGPRGARPGNRPGLGSGRQPTRAVASSSHPEGLTGFVPSRQPPDGHRRSVDGSGPRRGEVRRIPRQASVPSPRLWSMYPWAVGDKPNWSRFSRGGRHSRSDRRLTG